MHPETPGDFCTGNALIKKLLNQNTVSKSHVDPFARARTSLRVDENGLEGGVHERRCRAVL